MTPFQLAQEAEKFFIDLGFSKLPDSFWKNSIFENPDNGKDMICHPKSYDFCSGDPEGDYRFKYLF